MQALIARERIDAGTPPPGAERGPEAEARALLRERLGRAVYVSWMGTRGLKEVTGVVERVGDAFAVVRTLREPRRAHAVRLASLIHVKDVIPDAGNPRPRHRPPDRADR